MGHCRDRNARHRTEIAKGAQSALDLLKDLIARDGVRLSAGEPGVPPGTRAVLQKTWRETFIKKHPAEEYEARKRAFNRATGELQKRDLVDFYDEFAWLL